MIPGIQRLNLRQSLTAMAATVVLCAHPAWATAAENYPEKPITIVVPAAAGSMNDTVARLIGRELTEVWGQPIIVESKPGAGTTIGTRYVANAPNDGYTALLTFTAHVQNPSLFPNIGYDALNDFEPVSEIGKSSTILAVSPDFPVRTLPELVELVQQNPGKYPYGSYGAGSTGHILGELIKREANLDMEHIAYKGSAPLGTDLAAGHIDIGLIAVGTAKALLDSGKLIPVAIAGAERSVILPDVPTFLEHGYDGFEPNAWMGLLLPAGVPAERVEKLSREVARIVNHPDMAPRFIELNMEPVGSTSDEFRQVLHNDYHKWSEIIEQLGIRQE